MEAELILDWNQAEWRNSEDEGLAAYVRGYELSVEASEVQRHNPDVRPYFWRVAMTSEISEWPETYNCGFADTMEEGQHLARRSVMKALRA
jgi:hypothetical protein